MKEVKYEEFDSMLMEISGFIGYICDIENYEMLHLTKAGMDAYDLKTIDEYKGKKCYEVLHGRSEPCPFCKNSKLREGEEYRWENYNQKIKCQFDISDILIKVNGRLCKAGIIRDVINQKGHFSPLSNQFAMERVLFQCLHILAEETDMYAAIHKFLKEIGTYYKADRAYIFEIDYTQDRINNTFEWCKTDVSAEINKLQNLPLSLVEDWVQKFENDGGVSINFLQEETDCCSEVYQVLEEQGIKKLIAVPLARDGIIVGFIGVDNPKQSNGGLSLLRSVSEFILAELERRRLMMELKRLSYTDILTGASNRNRYAEVLKIYQLQIPESFGVISVSINGLKGINENFGQKYGDAVIVKTVEHLRECLQTEIYRIGGDEFVALYPNVEREVIVSFVSRLRELFLKEMEYSVSIGYAWEAGEADISTQIKKSDERMRVEKQLYYRDEYEKGGRLGNSASEIFKEIEDGRFVVYYQPQIDLQTGEIVGAEALVRKRGDKGEIIPPGQFVPYYEARNVLQHLDLHVLELVLISIRELKKQGIDFNVSVNFSRSTLLVPDFVNYVLALCKKYDVPTANITVEVTETISTIGRETLKDLLEDIRKAGLRLSLDDFGSKYSNLSILTDIAFDEVKFDKTLVDDICDNERGQIILKKLMQLCQELRETLIVAEGIEFGEQAELLKSYLCDYGQGYHFYRPMPLEQLVPLLKE